MKTKNIIVGIIFPIIIPIFILVIAFLAYYLIEPKPLVIFAGGGSVNKFLETKGIETNEFPHSVYSNMPSGYVESLLIEEIQRFGKENEAKRPFLTILLSNNKIVDWNRESLKPFLYIGLSAEKINYNQLFKSEYAQVYEYYIGKDSLAVYYVDKKNKQYQDTIKDYNIDKLENVLRDSTEHKIKIYTTTPESGTRKAYVNYLKNEIDSVELMRKLNKAIFFF